MKFESAELFKTWLMVEGHGELKQQAETLDLSVFEALRAVYEKYGDPSENAELHHIVGSLGEAVAELMQLSVSFSAIADKKAFVMDSGLTLYSQMKDAIGRDDSNISKTLRPEGEDLDESVTDPIAKQVIEGVLAAGPQYGIHL
jgi:hypothetical protein